MADNTFRVGEAGKKGGSFFSVIENVLNVDALFEEGLPLKYIPYILFVMAFGIFYIGNNHYAEKTIRQIDKLQLEVENLRADFTTLKSDYMFDSKQSEVAKKVKERGLAESEVPPEKILLTELEY